MQRNILAEGNIIVSKDYVVTDLVVSYAGDIAWKHTSLG